MKTQTLLVVSFIILSIVSAYHMTQVAEQIESHSGGVGPIDLMMDGYDVSTVQEALEAYGESGREYYLAVERREEFIVPFIYGMTMFLVMWGALTYTLPTRRRWMRHISFLPLMALIPEVIENLGVISLLESYPTSLDPRLIGTMSTITVVKWSMIKGASLIMFASIVVATIKRLRSKRS